MNNVFDRSSAIRHTLQTFLTIITVLGVVWGVGKPWAAEFVRNTTKPELMDLADSVDALKAGQTAQAQRTEEIHAQQSRTEAEIQNLKEFAKEQRQDTKQILFHLRKP